MSVNIRGPGYAAGLRAAGLVVDDSALGCALGALLAVRLGWVVARRLVGDQVDPGEREATQALQEFLRDLADRARRDPPRDVVRDGSRAAGDVRVTA
jgi:hypothetical protein